MAGWTLRGPDLLGWLSIYKDAGLSVHVLFITCCQGCYFSKGECFSRQFLLRKKQLGVLRRSLGVSLGIGMARRHVGELGQAKLEEVPCERTQIAFAGKP